MKKLKIEQILIGDTLIFIKWSNGKCQNYEYDDFRDMRELK